MRIVSQNRDLSIDFDRCEIWTQNNLIYRRVGHESIDITYRYAHLFPSKGKEIANKLNEENGVITNDEEE